MHGKITLNVLDIDKIIQLVFFDSSDAAHDEADRLREEHTAPFRKMYEELITGKIDSFDFMLNETWYIAARSTRPGVLVQVSVIWLKDGEIIPISHKNVNNFHDLEEFIQPEITEIRWSKNPQVKVA